MRLTLVLLSAFVLMTAASSTSLSGCAGAISCRKVVANGLEFDCRFAGPSASEANHKANVMFLHGFPEWSAMYMPIMTRLSDLGYHSVACNQRGYSLGAAPPNVEDYNYGKLRDDVWAVAEAVGYKNFHLIGHDHGAVLGWTIAASSKGKANLLSYTAMSIPHIDAFSKSLCGPEADIEQQIASQYFTVFIMENSASLRVYALWNTMGRISNGLIKDSATFEDEDHFQKALYWYNGAMATGEMAIPPLLSASFLLKYGSVTSTAMAAITKTYGGTPNNGTCQTNPVGKVPMPVLYICGTADPAIYCHKPQALKTKDYCQGDYKYVGVDCGHDVLNCGEDAETEKTILAIADHLASHNTMPVYASGAVHALPLALASIAALFLI